MSRDTIRTLCPGCRAALRVPPERAGRAVKCKRCQTVVRVPADAPTSNSSPEEAPGADEPVANDFPAPAPRPPARPAASVLPPALARPVVVPVPVPPMPAPYVPPPAEPDLFTTPLVGDSPTLERYRRPARRVSGLVWAMLTVGMVLALVGGYLFLGKALFESSKDQAETPPTAAPERPKPAPSSAMANASKRFPRRMLVLNVSNYLYCNALAAGTDKTPDVVAVAAKRLAYQWRVPMDQGQEQLFLVSDVGGDARPMLKATLSEAVTKFADTSRPQDRTCVYFGGHATVIEGKAYLVPVEGDLTAAATLLPLAEFFAAVQKSPAQERCVVFDVCRANEEGDKARPGSEPMTEELFKALTSPPPGVQVVVTCGPGQNALEFRAPPVGAADVGGSLFLSAVLHLAERAKVKLDAEPGPGDALPLKAWVDAAAKRMAEVAKAAALPAPTLKLAGSDDGEAVAYDEQAPPAARLALSTPPPGMPAAEVAKLTARINALPPYRGANTGTDRVETLVPFAADVMGAYRPDEMTDADILKNRAKYPVRAAAIDALTVIAKEWKSASDGSTELRDRITGGTTEALKKAVVAEQEQPAVIELELSERLAVAEKLEDKVAEEPSKYWQVTFLYSLAQLKARLAFIREYNLALGSIRTDSIPKVDEAKNETGLVLVSVGKMRSKKEVKDLAEAARELFGQIAEKHPGTPWAVQAKRHQVLALGLEWRPYVNAISAALQ